MRSLFCCPRRALEADSALQFQRAAGKAIGANSELRIWLWSSRAAAEADDRRSAAERERSDVQFVERIVGIEPQFDFGILAQHRELGQPELFHQAEIEFAVARPGKGITTDTGERNLVGSQIGCQGEVSGPSIGEIG